MYLFCIDFRKIIFFRWKNMIAYFPPSPSIFSISITTFFFLPIFSNFIITNQFFSLFSSISATPLPQFFFLYSNFGNLAAIIPIKFFLSSSTILTTWLSQFLFFHPGTPIIIWAALGSLHFGQEF